MGAFESICCSTIEHNSISNRTYSDSYSDFQMKAWKICTFSNNLFLMNIKYSKQRWQKAMLAVLQQYQIPKQNFQQMKQEIERNSLQQFQKDQQHYLDGGKFDDLTIRESDYYKKFIEEAIFDEHFDNIFQNNNNFQLYTNNIIITKQIKNESLYYPALDIYKIATQTIENHFRQQGNILNSMLQLYFIYYSNTYLNNNNQNYSQKQLGHGASINSFEDESIPSLFGSLHFSQFGSKFNKFNETELLQISIEDLKEFIYFFTFIVINFYELKKLQKLISDQNSEIPFLLTPDNLINFILSYVFSSKLIYQTQLELHLQGLSNDHQQFVESINKFQSNSISKFDIKKELCLSELSLRNLNSKSEESFEFTNIQNQADWDYLNPKKYKKPYQQAIDFLQLIIGVQSPIHKLKVLVQTREILDRSIKEFYEQIEKEYDYVVKKKDIQYDADQLISILDRRLIFTFKGYRTLHCKEVLIRLLLMTSSWNSSAGYLLTSFIAAVQHLINLN